MATDLTALRTYVRNQTLVETDDVSNANLNIMLNAGLNELSVMFEWPWLEAESTITTVADTKKYVVPTDYRMMYDIVDANRASTLRRITRNQALRRWGGDPPSSTNAIYYYVWAGYIYLLPYPSDAETDEYTIYYQKSITELSSDTDVPEFISEFHLLPAHYAIARVWEHEEDFPKAEAADAKFGQVAERMATYYHSRERDDPMVFGDGTQPRLLRNANMPWLDDAS